MTLSDEVAGKQIRCPQCQEVNKVLPGLQAFASGTSPMNHVDSFACPVFIFHARDDSNEPFKRTESFVNLMKASGKQITFLAADNGDHYQSMIDQGIPAAVEWIQKQ